MLILGVEMQTGVAGVTFWEEKHRDALGVDGVVDIKQASDAGPSTIVGVVNHI